MSASESSPVNQSITLRELRTISDGDAQGKFSDDDINLAVSQLPENIGGIAFKKDATHYIFNGSVFNAAEVLPKWRQDTNVYEGYNDPLPTRGTEYVLTPTQLSKPPKRWHIGKTALSGGIGLGLGETGEATGIFTSWELGLGAGIAATALSYVGLSLGAHRKAKREAVSKIRNMSEWIVSPESGAIEMQDIDVGKSYVLSDAPMWAKEILERDAYGTRRGYAIDIVLNVSMQELQKRFDERANRESDRTRESFARTAAFHRGQEVPERALAPVSKAVYSMRPPQDLYLHRRDGSYSIFNSNKIDVFPNDTITIIIKTGSQIEQLCRTVPGMNILWNDLDFHSQVVEMAKHTAIMQQMIDHRRLLEERNKFTDGQFTSELVKLDDTMKKMSDSLFDKMEAIYLDGQEYKKTGERDSRVFAAQQRLGEIMTGTIMQTHPLELHIQAFKTIASKALTERGADDDYDKLYAEVSTWLDSLRSSDDLYTDSSQTEKFYKGFRESFENRGLKLPDWDSVALSFPVINT